MMRIESAKKKLFCQKEKCNCHRRQKCCHFFFFVVVVALWRLEMYIMLGAGPAGVAVQHDHIRCWKREKESFIWDEKTWWNECILLSFYFYFLASIFECWSERHNGRATKALFPNRLGRLSSMSFSFSFFGWVGPGVLGVRDSFLVLGNIYCRLGIIEK